MSKTETWIGACKAEDVEREDVRRWDHDNRSFAIFRTSDDQYYVTDDICTHEYAHISDGFVDGTTIECPRHAGCFDIRTGAALNPPACANLKTFRAKLEGGIVYVRVDDE
jgi:3-phenylpropionate/trans-cinnamate dioxygenase ferredoxin subunit